MADKFMFTVANTRASEISERAPHRFVPNVPAYAKTTKALYTEWRGRTDTVHCMYSMMEGSLRGIRVSAENPIVRVHGLIVDYDAQITDGEVEAMKGKATLGEFRPNWIHKTFSGGRRLIWIFQSPVLVSNAEVAGVFIRVASEELKAERYLIHPDMNALLNPSIYYDVGTDWEELSTKRVPDDTVYSWFLDTCKKIDHKTVDTAVIPLEVVYEEMEKRFPGRWSGNFTYGASGVRFWDPQATSSRGCVVNRWGTGMMCFSGQAGFMSWAAIFGPAFAAKYLSETLGNVVSDTFYEQPTKKYWRRHQDGHYYGSGEVDMKLYLACTHQLSSKCLQGRASSPIMEALMLVQTNKQVIRAQPHIYRLPGEIVINGRRELNISTVKVIDPAPEEGNPSWGGKFPFLAKFFEVFFPEERSRNFFLAWLQHGYAPAYHHTPLPGQIVIIAGGRGRGKSLLTNKIIGGLLGGAFDIRDYLLGKDDRFLQDQMGHPVWVVNDSVPTTNSLQQVRFAAMLKKIAADTSFKCEAKFGGTGMVDWVGRCALSCNPDPESIRLLPGLEQSNRDKISFFSCNREVVFPFVFPAREQTEANIERELPFLARWLLHWDPPSYTRGDNRYVVKEYHDPDMLASSRDSGEASSFLEVLQMFLGDYQKTVEGTRESWFGTPTLLMSELHQNDATSHPSSKWSMAAISKFLGQLKARGLPLEQERKGNSRLWRIPFTLEDVADDQHEEAT